MIIVESVVKSFGKPPQEILHGLSFKIEDGEFVSISGRSGSGKSTLLYLISTLDTPTSGRILIDNHDIKQMSSKDIHTFRNRHVGFIFQFHFLLSELTALENILLPARNLKEVDAHKPQAYQLLEKLGMTSHAHKYPSQLSGGEQQRVAIARALLLKPKYLFADEPTGNLDTENADIVMKILADAHVEGATVCLVTHDPDFSKMAKREIYLIDGHITKSSRTEI